MSSYHIIGDLTALINSAVWTPGAGSKPTQTQAELWIEHTESVAEARLAGRYQTPITGARALEILKLICSQLTAARVWRAVFMGRATGSNDYADRLEDRADKLLQRYADGKETLPDAQATTGAAETPPGEPKSYWDDDVPEQAPAFTHDQVF